MLPRGVDEMRCTVLRHRVPLHHEIVFRARSEHETNLCSACDGHILRGLVFPLLHFARSYRGRSLAKCTLLSPATAQPGILSMSNHALPEKVDDAWILLRVKLVLAIAVQYCHILVKLYDAQSEHPRLCLIFVPVAPVA